MSLTRVREFRSGGRRFTLYEGGSWVLFEELEHGDAEGVGQITVIDGGYVATAWWKPRTEFVTAALDEAVDRLVDVEPPPSVAMHRSPLSPARGT